MTPFSILSLSAVLLLLSSSLLNQTLDLYNTTPAPLLALTVASSILLHGHRCLNGHHHRLPLLSPYSLSSNPNPSSKTRPTALQLPSSATAKSGLNLPKTLPLPPSPMPFVISDDTRFFFFFFESPSLQPQTTVASSSFCPLLLSSDLTMKSSKSSQIHLNLTTRKPKIPTHTEPLVPSSLKPQANLTPSPNF
ncbi:hypothetical protein COLO4_37396 [Corchorus olitorius]|uniref:Uncharacterized protein n=1 Tax=Corchorus olitorius TaxID=93759 RepID=A0A1R3G229_9ROSI|nr:hypothetical protein COLO4_37396 [Corchorus olitorius]